MHKRDFMHRNRWHPMSQRTNRLLVVALPRGRRPRTPDITGSISMPITNIAPTPSLQLMEEIAVKVAALQAQDKTLLGQQLAYEQARVHAEPPKAGLDERDVAATLLHGQADPP